MKIDIEPVIEKATGLNKIKMQMNNIEALYVVVLANGDEYTVTWDKKGLEEFQPNAKVSDMMNSWEESILRTIKTNEKAAKTGNHPTWKTWYKDEDGNQHQKPYPLSECSIDSFRKYVERDLKKVGKMKLVKLV